MCNASREGVESTNNAIFLIITTNTPLLRPDLLYLGSHISGSLRRGGLRKVPEVSNGLEVILGVDRYLLRKLILLIHGG